MDAKIRELFAKVKTSAADVSRKTGKAASGLMNQAKLNLRIAELNSGIDANYKELGKLLYAVHNGVEIPADAIDAALEEIDGKLDEINSLRDSLQAAKADVTCPVCGKYVGKKASFCSACGARIERAAAEAEPCEEVYVDAIPAEECCECECEEAVEECCCEETAGEACCCEEAEETCCCEETAEEAAEECCCCETGEKPVE